MFDWNDLQHLLAVGRHGSTIAAARALGVSQSTVQRRVTVLERRLGHTLVVRSARGYTLTPLGFDLLSPIEEIALAVEAVEQRVRAVAADGREIIRLTCPEPVVGRLLPLIERFHASYPAFAVEFVTSDRYLDLLKGDADVAFRSGDTDDALVGRKVADSVWGVYASASYIEAHGRPSDVAALSNHRVVGLEESMAGHRLMVWLKEFAPEAEVASRSDSILGLAQAAKSGLGFAALPMPVAAEAGLVLLFGPIAELARSWKLLTHPGLRRTARVSAFFDFILAEREVVKTIFG